MDQPILLMLLCYYQLKNDSSVSIIFSQLIKCKHTIVVAITTSSDKAHGWCLAIAIAPHDCFYTTCLTRSVKVLTAAFVQNAELVLALICFCMAKLTQIVSFQSSVSHKPERELVNSLTRL